MMTLKLAFALGKFGGIKVYVEVAQDAYQSTARAYMKLLIEVHSVYPRIFGGCFRTHLSLLNFVC